MRGKPVFSEQGMALPITIIMMVVLAFLMLGFAALYSGRLHLNTSYVDKYNAQYIAETGLNRYLWVLNNDPYNVNTFVTQNNFYQGYSQEGNGFYNIYCTTSLVGVSSPSSLNLVCTGWLANDARNQFSFTATVQVREFNQYLYWTQNEIDSGNNTVYWGPQDNVYGGVFTDSIIHTQNDNSVTPVKTPTFYGVVNYNDNNAGQAAAEAAQLSATVIPNYGGSGIPTEFESPYCPNNLPSYASYMNLPPNNKALMAVAEDGQGYYYNGRTCIYLEGNQMEVECHIGGALTPTWNNGEGEGNPIPLPPNGVIYVYGNSSGPNTQSGYYPETKFSSASLANGDVYVSGTLNGQLTIAAADNIYLTAGDPTNMHNGTIGNPPTLTNSVNPNSNLVTYSNTSFSGSPDYTSASGTDMLGLVANNNVMILRWGWPTDSSNGGYYCTGATPGSYTDYSPQPTQAGTSGPVLLDGAVMAINGSFQYESYWYSAISPNLSSTYCSSTTPVAYTYPTLKITGSVIQPIRGGVSESMIDLNPTSKTYLQPYLQCGYLKNYYYDPRMSSEMPPRFLQPANSGWGTYGWYMPGTSNQISPQFLYGAVSQSNPGGISQSNPYNPANPNVDRWSEGSSIVVNTYPTQNNFALTHGGSAQQMTAVVTSVNGYNTPQAVAWSLTDPNTTSTGTTIDPDTGLLTPGSASGTKPLTVTAKANGSTNSSGAPVTGTASITIN